MRKRVRFQYNPFAASMFAIMIHSSCGWLSLRREVQSTILYLKAIPRTLRELPSSKSFMTLKYFVPICRPCTEIPLAAFTKWRRDTVELRFRKANNDVLLPNRMLLRTLMVEPILMKSTTLIEPPMHAWKEYSVPKFVALRWRSLTIAPNRKSSKKSTKQLSMYLLDHRHSAMHSQAATQWYTWR